jgi:hypothetical protein
LTTQSTTEKEYVQMKKLISVLVVGIAKAMHQDVAFVVAIIAAGCIFAILAPRAMALTSTECSGQGGFCDASNTCRRNVYLPERGFSEEVLGTCSRGGSGGVGEETPREPTVKFTQATVADNIAPFAPSEGFYQPVAKLRPTREQCAGRFDLIVDFELKNSKKCCEFNDPRTFARSRESSDLNIRVSGQSFNDRGTNGQVTISLVAPKRDPNPAKGSITLSISGNKNNGERYQDIAVVQLVCK